MIPEFLRPIHSSGLPGGEIVPHLLVSTATPMALLLLGNTSSESKVIRPNNLLFPYRLARED